MSKSKFFIRAAIVQDDGTETLPITTVGRDAWLLDRLIRAGERGLTTLEIPAPRTSGYLFKLRGFGFEITTEYESHQGTFAGRHGRYRLRSKVRIVERSEDAA